MSEETRKYLSQFINLTGKIQEKIERHAKRYGIKPEICAWYFDWEDFCSDWCDGLGYTRTEARKFFHDGHGEFMVLPGNNGIVRFVI